MRSHIKMSELIDAIDNNYTASALTLINAKVDLNVQNSDGNTALILACCRKLPKIALALIKAGADVNVQNSEGDTALLVVCWDKLSEVALALIEAGADVNIQDRNGDTALLVTCLNRLSEVALALIAAGANINVQNSDGDTALLLAHDNNLSEVALALVKSDLIYISHFNDLEDIEVRKALSFNFPEYPIRCEFTLNDAYLLNAENYQRVQNIMLLHQTLDNVLSIIPIELIELILKQLFK